MNQPKNVNDPTNVPVGEWTDEMERDSWGSYEDEYTSYLTFRAIEKYFSFKRNDEKHKSVLTKIEYLSDFGRERPIWRVHFDETTFDSKGEVLIHYTTEWLIYRSYGTRDDHFKSFDGQEVKRAPDPAKIARSLTGEAE